MNPQDNNQEIISFILQKDRLNQFYSKDDLAFIAQYTGSGGQTKQGAKGAGILNEFYTPDYLASQMWQLAEAHGLAKQPKVLEPSVGTGKLFAPSKAYTDENNLYAFEVNPVNKRIAELLYPKAHIYPKNETLHTLNQSNNLFRDDGAIMSNTNGYFETAFLQWNDGRSTFNQLLKNKKTWLTGYPFDLVIGNPPYGVYNNFHSHFFKKDYKKISQIEFFFIVKGLELLKQGGLMVFLVSSNVMRNGDKYNQNKEYINNLADLVDAYRLPNNVFENTSVPTDILIFKRKNFL